MAKRIGPRTLGILENMGFLAGLLAVCMHKLRVVLVGTGVLLMVAGLLINDTLVAVNLAVMGVLLLGILIGGRIAKQAENLLESSRWESQKGEQNLERRKHDRKRSL